MRHVAIVRILSGLPLAAIGAAQLFGGVPLPPVLEGAGTPFSALSALFVTLAEVVAGLLLIAGVRVRFGALLALGALFAQMSADWTQGPLALLPVAVMAGTSYVLVRGPGCVWCQAPRIFSRLDNIAV